MSFYDLKISGRFGQAKKCMESRGLKCNPGQISRKYWFSNHYMKNFFSKLGVLFRTKLYREGFWPNVWSFEECILLVSTLQFFGSYRLSKV